MLRGSCLCGGVRFEITGPHSKIGFCHCSRCRKLSGVGSMAGIVLAFEQLSWVCGAELLNEGIKNAICRVCGSPLPDADSDKTTYYVPPGLLDGDPQLLVGDHIYVADKASWDVIGDDAPRYAADGPRLERDQLT